ncbi:MAG: hypothetical protein AAGI46_16890, partial [Planctomycetota bacterium]
MQADLQLVVPQVNVRRQRIIEVAKTSLEAVVAGPGELAGRLVASLGSWNFGPNTEVARACAGFVVLADVRELAIAQRILIVNREEQTAITNRKIAWHVSPESA